MALATDLLDAYGAALDAVNGTHAVRGWLEAHPRPGPVALVALGKAAPAMAEGAVQVLGSQVTRGLAVCPQGHAPETPPACLKVLESAHPLPDRRSVAAGEALVGFLRGLRDQEHLLVLLSGGTSSLVELPVTGVDADALARLNRQLLADGYGIEIINAARKSISRIKGGRLGYWLDGRPATVLAISDVPGNALNVIGSGLLHPDPEPVALPAALRALLGEVDNPAPRPGDPALAGVEAQVIADNDGALRAAAASLRAAGYRIDCPGPFLAGDVREVASDLAAVLRAPADTADILLWGGEPTVHLPSPAGRGGRMHALAAELALALGDRGEWAVLAAGTDGMDGNSGHAGALVDSRIARVLGREGLRAALKAADTATALERADAVIDTGPTGTNVMDLVLARPASA